MMSETNNALDIHDGLVVAAQALRNIGRLNSEVAVLKAAAERRSNSETLKALLKGAERVHDKATATAAFEKLEAFYVARNDEDELATLRKTRLTFLDNTPQGAKPRVAGIMDEFTTASYMPECIYLPLDPDNACRQLEEFKPDFVFVESAWHGNDNTWNRMVSTVSDPLTDMLAWCTENAIPSVFWNKEDPVHFNTFITAAGLCDFVFTTDMDCIPAYKDALGHERVYFLPFAAQPQSHNPIATMPRKDAFNFAGSYYLRYPERQRDIAAIIDTVSTFRPVEIYDRNHENDHPHYKFPEDYRSMILGSLPFSEIDKAYKGYRYGINMNTIKQSQTMFARRVYELMASNTVVVSNFSRGVRMMFGDLAICSDQRDQLAATLRSLADDDMQYRKFRLLGLRKVMREHTYAARLAYILSKVRGQPYKEAASATALVATAPTLQAAEALIGQFHAQTHANKHLFLFSPEGMTKGTYQDVSVFQDAGNLVATVMADATRFDFFGELHAEDHYGPNYLTDLTLATRYSDAEGFGKGCHFGLDLEGPVLHREDLRYGFAEALPLRAALLRCGHLNADILSEVLQFPGITQASGPRLLALDEFNYCRDGADSEAAAALVHDLELPFQGISTTSLYDAAERLPAAKPRTRPRRAAFPMLSAKSFFSSAVVSKSVPLKKELTGNRLTATREADTGQAAYLWMNKKLRRDTLNLTDQSTLNFEMDYTLPQGNLVCEFYGADNKKISHSMLVSGGSHALAIPNNCTQLRFGLRLVGTGKISIGDISFGSDGAMPPVIIGPSDTLVLTKQYPSYDDLYKYGFLHSRIRGYRSQGVGVDIFRINPGIEKPYDEFENIDVATGDAELLDVTLGTGRYRHVLVHMLDRKMWDVLKNHLDHVRVTIWIHGAEIQDWPRRAYEFTKMTPEQIDRKKKLAAERMKLWRQIFETQSSNLHFVFVSEIMKREAEEDIGMAPPDGSWSVIHNHIDGDLFSYSPKTAEDRGKVLSVRPYSSLTYANDLSVAAIQELAKRPVFKELSFCLVGSGDLFKPLTAPIAHHPNVELHETFLPQHEIAEWHKRHGVFLCPSRMDSQGVSRDEAMASGLVPVTTDIAAIPEFVDDNSGILTPPEDPVALADAIERLYHDPDLFLRLSQGAAERVRRQSGFEQTVERELDLIRIPTQITPSDRIHE